MGEYRGDRRRTPRGTDRRREPRAGASLEARLRLSAAFLDAAETDPVPLNLYATARDVSRSGLGLVVPSLRLDERACAEGHPLRVTLGLGFDGVELEAEPVHCGPLNPGEPEAGSVIGARFIEMGEEPLEALAEYLRKVLGAEGGAPQNQ